MKRVTPLLSIVAARTMRFATVIEAMHGMHHRHHVQIIIMPRALSKQVGLV